MKKTTNQKFHVYILRSESNPQMVKVGKANNLKRVPYFNKAGYAGVTDWAQVFSLPTDSNESALALESMICAKLASQGYLRPKIMWDDLTKPGRRVGATECYCCHIDHALRVANEMARVHREFVCCA